MVSTLGDRRRGRSSTARTRRATSPSIARSSKYFGLAVEDRRVLAAEHGVAEDRTRDVTSRARHAPALLVGGGRNLSGPLAGVRRARRASSRDPGRSMKRRDVLHDLGAARRPSRRTASRSPPRVAKPSRAMPSISGAVRRQRLAHDELVVVGEPDVAAERERRVTLGPVRRELVAAWSRAGAASATPSRRRSRPAPAAARARRPATPRPRRRRPRAGSRSAPPTTKRAERRAAARTDPGPPAPCCTAAPAARSGGERRRHPAPTPPRPSARPGPYRRRHS